MPTYEYICDDCKHEFDAFESIKSDAQTVCPTCGKPTLRRKIGAGAAIIFKGSGFYQTDYRSESYKAGAKADKPADSGGSTSSTTSTPAAKSDSGGGSSSTPSTTTTSGSGAAT